MSSARATALTESDVRILVKGADPDERAAAAHKLCRKIDRVELTDEERAAAHNILRVMAADAAELVRRALAVTLRNSPELPRDVALRLARDVESVAIPVLNHSPAFTDEDLAEIVRDSAAAKQIAVARRPKLQEKAASAIAEYGVEEAVQIASANDNVSFPEAALQRILDRFAEHEAMTETMAHRRSLPLSVTERLVTIASEEVREHLLNHHALSPETAIRIALGARERATVDLVEQAGRTPDLQAFAAHLNAAKRLTPSLLLRALAAGHMGFFEWAIAELAGVPHHRTWLMIHDAGPLGLRAIYERAGLPTRLYPAFRAGVDTFRSLEQEGGVHDRETFQSRMLQRFLTQSQAAAKDDLDYLLEKMDRLHARRTEQERGAA